MATEKGQPVNWADLSDEENEDELVDTKKSKQQTAPEKEEIPVSQPKQEQVQEQEQAEQHQQQQQQQQQGSYQQKRYQNKQPYQGREGQGQEGQQYQNRPPQEGDQPRRKNLNRNELIDEIKKQETNETVLRIYRCDENMIKKNILEAFPEIEFAEIIMRFEGQALLVFATREEAIRFIRIRDRLINNNRYFIGLGHKTKRMENDGWSEVGFGGQIVKHAKNYERNYDKNQGQQSYNRPRGIKEQIEFYQNHNVKGEYNKRDNNNNNNGNNGNNNNQGGQSFQRREEPVEGGAGRQIKDSNYASHKPNQTEGASGEAENNFQYEDKPRRNYEHAHQYKKYHQNPREGGKEGEAHREGGYKKKPYNNEGGAEGGQPRNQEKKRHWEERDKTKPAEGEVEGGEGQSENQQDQKYKNYKHKSRRDQNDEVRRELEQEGLSTRFFLGRKLTQEAATDQPQEFHKIGFHKGGSTPATSAADEKKEQATSANPLGKAQASEQQAAENKPELVQKTVQVDVQSSQPAPAVHQQQPKSSAPATAEDKNSSKSAPAQATSAPAQAVPAQAVPANHPVQQSTAPVTSAPVEEKTKPKVHEPSNQGHQRNEVQQQAARPATATAPAPVTQQKASPATQAHQQQQQAQKQPNQQQAQQQYQQQQQQKQQQQKAVQDEEEEDEEQNNKPQDDGWVVVGPKDVKKKKTPQQKPEQQQQRKEQQPGKGKNQNNKGGNNNRFDV